MVFVFIFKKKRQKYCNELNRRLSFYSNALKHHILLVARIFSAKLCSVMMVFRRNLDGQNLTFLCLISTYSQTVISTHKNISIWNCCASEKICHRFLVMPPDIKYFNSVSNSHSIYLYLSFSIPVSLFVFCSISFSFCISLLLSSSFLSLLSLSFYLSLYIFLSHPLSLSSYL